MSQLDDIVARRLRDVRYRKARVPIETLREAARRRSPSRGFAPALCAGAPSIIAEFKRSSPSAGLIGERDVATIARAYQAGGAHALSILTEPTWFGGGLDDLARARAASTLPTLRKDFIVDEYQIWESAAACADAILLIVGILTTAELDAFRGIAESLGMDALVEVHDESEARRALRAGAKIVGINNRDLRTMQVDLTTAPRVCRALPGRCTIVAESGYRSAADLETCTRAGVDAVLVGESLMRADDPVAALERLRGVPV